MYYTLRNEKIKYTIQKEHIRTIILRSLIISTQVTKFILAHRKQFSRSRFFGDINFLMSLAAWDEMSLAGQHQ